MADSNSLLSLVCSLMAVFRNDRMITSNISSEDSSAFSQERLYHDQRILHGRPKATNRSPKTIVGSLQTKGFGTDQLEIHRYHLQVRSRSIPDHQRKTKVYGTTQEGKDRFRRNRKLKSSFKLLKKILFKNTIFCSNLI